MKKILLGSASALAFLALSGTAQAQSLSDEIGANLIGLQTTFANGNWTNISVNTNTIDGSVTLDGNGFAGAINVDLGSLNLDAQGSAALAAALGISLDDLLALSPAALGAALAASASAQLLVGIDLGSVVADLTVGGTVISRDVIETLAAGAINTGDIASVAAASSAANNSSTNFSFGGISSSSSEAASSASNSAANTSSTAASAAASASTNTSEAFNFGAIGFSTSQAANQAASGPLTDVYAQNLAYNRASINGSVDINANLVDLNGIGTTAIGAVNSGSISMGFDGAALVGARVSAGLNGDDE